MTTAVATTTMRYPLARVAYGPEEIRAVLDVLESGQTTCGPRVAEFERRFAEYVGRDHAIMVNSGSSADLLVAFGLGPANPGDEVLVPAVTWPTQVWSCVMAGYRVRLVDVEPATLQMDLGDFERKVSVQTKAVFTVHVLGNVGDMERLTSVAATRGIAVVEDCCEALGSRWNGKHVGTFGQAAAFSFFFSHVLNTMEGGMVVTNDGDRQYRLWRAHGWEPKADYRFWFPSMGFNVRPMEVQGAFGSVQLNRLEGVLKARRRNSDRLAAHVWQLRDGLFPAHWLSECEPAWHGFPLLVEDRAPFSRDELCRYLEARGVETRPIIAGNIARQPAVQASRWVDGGPGELKGADAIHERGFYIGLASHDDPDGCDYVGEVLRDFMRDHG